MAHPMERPPQLSRRARNRCLSSIVIGLLPRVTDHMSFLPGPSRSVANYRRGRGLLRLRRLLRTGSTGSRRVGSRLTSQRRQAVRPVGRPDASQMQLQSYPLLESPRLLRRRRQLKRPPRNRARKIKHADSSFSPTLACPNPSVVRRATSTLSSYARHSNFLRSRLLAQMLDV